MKVEEEGDESHFFEPPSNDVNNTSTSIINTSNSNPNDKNNEISDDCPRNVRVHDHDNEHCFDDLRSIQMSQREDIARVRSMGLDVDDDNEPVPKIFPMRMK